MCDTEFTIEQGKLWMLQTRVGKRTGRAALRMAVEMTDGAQDPAARGPRPSDASPRTTSSRCSTPSSPPAGTRCSPRASGRRRGPRSGAAYFTADDAAAAAARGEAVILVRSETSPEDVHGMLAAQGILTARGGLVSHAAVVARGLGQAGGGRRRGAAARGHRVTVGDVDGGRGGLALDRRHRRHGRARPGPADRSRAAAGVRHVLAWADDIRAGHLGVRANADTGADAANARRLGAEGIGLCRTEHMFLAEDRLPIVRRMILADTPEEETAALEELRVAQRADFVEILEAMDGLPVTVRLLDPPLHEFLPSTHELAIKEATVGLRRRGAAALRGGQGVAGGQPDARHPRGAARGDQARASTRMQVSALMEAAADRVASRAAAPSSR